MERATQSPAQILSGVKRAQNESGLFSSESVLGILKLIFLASPLAEVLTIIARLGRVSKRRHVVHYLASR